MVVIPFNHGQTFQIVGQLAAGWQNVSQCLMDYPSSVLHLLFDTNEFLFAKNLVEMNSGMDPELKMVPTSITCPSAIDSQWGIYYLKAPQRWPSESNTC